jgi:ABC-type transport system involved in multi-copper enzyme maturation permease subunit
MALGGGAIRQFWLADRGRVRPGPPFLTQDEASAFAASFFVIFMIVQFVMAGLVTPIFTAAAIAEEKERRTLDYLLTTHLHDREIVLGKLAARLGQLFLVLLTGLPVLSLLLFMAGVDPDRLLAGFAATAATMVARSGDG